MAPVPSSELFNLLNQRLNMKTIRNELKTFIEKAEELTMIERIKLSNKSKNPFEDSNEDENNSLEVLEFYKLTI